MRELCAVCRLINMHYDDVVVLSDYFFFRAGEIRVSYWTQPRKTASAAVSHQL